MKKEIKNLSLSAMFLALGLVLPFLTMQIPAIGKMLLPMHIPVLLCGLICGWKWGLIVGLIVPLLRSTMFGMPIMYPAAIAMAAELATYGAISGYIYHNMKYQCIPGVYKSLVAAMIAGRVVWGAAMMIILGVKGGAFTWGAFMTGAIIEAVPGIILQLILIPLIMVVLNNAGLIRFRRQPDDGADNRVLENN